MGKKQYDINKDWETTMPFRILEGVIFLMLAAHITTHPDSANDFIPYSLMDYLKSVALFGLWLYFVSNAYLRIRHRQTAGAFLAIDYFIVGSGILSILVISITLLMAF